MITGTTLLRSKRGLMAKVAKGLGVTKSAVSMWIQIPAERVAGVSRITGFSPHALRPDLFGEDGRAEGL